MKAAPDRVTVDSSFIHWRGSSNTTVSFFFSSEKFGRLRTYFMTLFCTVSWTVYIAIISNNLSFKHKMLLLINFTSSNIFWVEEEQTVADFLSLH